MEEEEEDTNDSVLRSIPNWNIQVGFAGETMASAIGRINLTSNITWRCMMEKGEIGLEER